MPRPLTLILAVLLSLLALADVRAQPTTRPATPAVVYGAINRVGGSPVGLGPHDVGLPLLCNVGLAWYGPQMADALAVDAAILVDVEPDSPIYGLKPGIYARTRAKAHVEAEFRDVAQFQAFVARARRDAPTRRIIAFTNWPIALGMQYPEALAEMPGRIADSRRFVRTGVFDGVDAVAVNCYLHRDDIAGTTPASAAGFTRNRITVARAALPGKPLVVVLNVRFQASNVDVPEAVLAAQLAVVAEAGLEAAVWADGEGDKAAARYGRMLARLVRR